jgi:hypothetical protein
VVIVCIIRSVLHRLRESAHTIFSSSRVLDFDRTPPVLNRAFDRTNHFLGDIPQRAGQLEERVVFLELELNQLQVRARVGCRRTLVVGALPLGARLPLPAPGRRSAATRECAVAQAAAQRERLQAGGAPEEAPQHVAPGPDVAAVEEQGPEVAEHGEAPGLAVVQQRRRREAEQLQAPRVAQGPQDAEVAGPVHQRRLDDGRRQALQGDRRRIAKDAQRDEAGCHEDQLVEPVCEAVLLDGQLLERASGTRSGTPAATCLPGPGSQRRDRPRSCSSGSGRRGAAS